MSSIGTAGEEAVAVVGLACRVPGAEDPDTFWAHLLAGVDSVRRFAPDELVAAGVPARWREDPDWVPAFGYLAGLTDVDSELFRLGDREAALLDPQHRLFLEVAWSAMEDACCDASRSTAHIGVFAGCGANRYLQHHLWNNQAALGSAAAPHDPEETIAASSADYLPALAAYKLGLDGPAVAVQTSCSSSLVAVCLAAQNLLDYRCDVAVAGGAAVPSTRQAGYLYRSDGTASRSGRCRPYDADADGQVFGNGAAAVVLKRLSDALADHDHVHAVLAGWAVNSDGADRAGFLVPGTRGPSAVVAEALASTPWHPEQIGLLEGHGTGTPVGDALEVSALARALRSGSGRQAWCRLGSAKGNLGNLDAAAGVVGLVKAICAVREGVLPQTLGGRPHPDLDLARTPFVLGFEAEPWRTDDPRRAGVSSSGQSGTNAHVIVDQPPARGPGDPDEATWQLVALSAAGPPALSALAGRLADRLERDPAGRLSDVAYSLAIGRRPLAVRCAVLARTPAEAVVGLRAGAGAADPEDAPEALRTAAARWCRGEPVDIPAGRAIPLPTYPFQRRRAWIDPVPDRAEATR